MIWFILDFNGCQVDIVNLFSCFHLKAILPRYLTLSLFFLLFLNQENSIWTKDKVKKLSAHLLSLGPMMRPVLSYGLEWWPRLTGLSVSIHRPRPPIHYDASTILHHPLCVMCIIYTLCTYVYIYKHTGCLKKNWVLANLAVANIAALGEKSLYKSWWIKRCLSLSLNAYSENSDVASIWSKVIIWMKLSLNWVFYSCPRLVSPKSEELISQLFVGEI